MITPREPMARIERVALVAGLLIAAALMWPVRDNLHDATFVHLQLARHLAQGHGFEFNTGHRVYSTLSPLWVSLVADGMMLGIEGLRGARMLGLLATLASVGLFLQLARRTLKSPALRALATVTWATQPWMMGWSLSGMETPLAVTLMLAGFVAFTEGRQWGSRPVRTGALWALAALTRPELVLLLVLWFALAIVDAHNRSGTRRLLFGLTAAAIIYGVWLLFARVYFGTFWPLMLSSGAVTSPSPELRAPNLERQIVLFANGDGVLAVALVVALAFGWRRLWALRDVPNLALQPLLPWLWVVLLPALYVTRGVPAAKRHLVLLAPLVAWLAWRALDRWWVGETPSPRRERTAAVAGLVVAVLAIGQHLLVFEGQVVPEVRARTETLRGTLMHWGRWFARFAPPGSTVAAPEVGTIAYISGLRVFDTSGRITPHAQSGPGLGVPQRLAFAPGERPMFLVDRDVAPYALARHAPYRSCLTPIGATGAYTVYRIDWVVCDSLATR